ncbi:hypothetical protein B484DRAFT_410448 [Ochromonadaceae sp. CCMP2298]|nr:hypothetical protein B484DRAFT_410448 [Ochromonadaceae sp. CCMP2298]
MSGAAESGDENEQEEQVGEDEDEVEGLVFPVIDVNYGGNYALGAGVVGALPWPPAGVPPAASGHLAVVPPAALGRFISSQAEVANKSGPASTLFHMANNVAMRLKVNVNLVVYHTQ